MQSELMMEVASALRKNVGRLASRLVRPNPLYVPRSENLPVSRCRNKKLLKNQMTHLAPSCAKLRAP